MNFPEVWRFEYKPDPVKIENFSSNDAVALKLTTKMPVLQVVS